MTELTIFHSQHTNHKSYSKFKSNYNLLNWIKDTDGEVRIFQNWNLRTSMKTQSYSQKEIKIIFNLDFLLPQGN
jgi:hypothetical protein